MPLMHAVQIRNDTTLMHGWIMDDFSCIQPSINLVKTLLAHGANVHVQTRRGDTVLDFLIQGSEEANTIEIMLREAGAPERKIPAITTATQETALPREEIREPREIGVLHGDIGVMLRGLNENNFSTKNHP